MDAAPTRAPAQRQAVPSLHAGPGPAAGDPAAAPADKPGDKPADKPADGPAGGPAGDPAGDPAGNLARRSRQRPAGAALVRVQRMTMAFGRKLIQRDLDFDIRAGEVFVIVGGSGCGKSTLLRHLIGLQAPAAGQVFYGDRDLYASDDATLAALRREFGVMFQAGALWSSMTVGENVMLPLQMFTGMDETAREQEARFKLALVGLADSFELEPAALSGGMKKRAAIARALALDPALLFLDEPSAGLDPLTSALLDELILHLRNDLRTTVVMVSHELESIFTVADRVLFLDAETKTMTALGPPQQLQQHGPEGVRRFLRRGAGAAAGDRPANPPDEGSS